MGVMQLFMKGGSAALPRDRARRFAASGVTLIELMVVTALVVVLLTLAAPPFKRMIEMQRVRGVHDQLVTDLQFARSEAARIGKVVRVRIIQQSVSAAACYSIFSDVNRLPVNWAASCDCRLTSPCTSADTEEIRTVRLDLAHAINFRVSGIPLRFDSMGFDPFTGGMVALTSDRAGAIPGPVSINTTLDTERTLRAVVELSGRPSTCAPAGSIVKVTGC